MKTYLVTATDPLGKRQTIGRPAASIPQLRETLEQEGFCDLEFVDDEMLATLRSQWPDELAPSSPSEYELIAKASVEPGARLAWQAALRRFGLSFVVIGAFVVYGIWSGHWKWSIVAVLLMTAGCVLVYFQSRRITDYNELMAALARGERVRARALLHGMIDKGYVRNLAQIREDLLFREAVLDAAEGRLEEALDMVQPLRDGVYGSGGMFEGRVAGLYYAAARYPEFLEQLENALVVSGDGVLQRLDLAFAHARVGDCQRARALLADIECRNLTAWQKPAAIAVEGICARREGDASAAVLVLEEAFRHLDAFAANPVAWPLYGVLVGNLAAALQQSGRVTEARQLLAPWTDVVRTNLDADTLRQIETEMTD